MERRRNNKDRPLKPTVISEIEGIALVDSGPVLERLARIETRLEMIEMQNGDLAKMRDEFIVMRAKWGLVAGAVGALFSILVGFGLSLLKGG